MPSTHNPLTNNPENTSSVVLLVKELANPALKDKLEDVEDADLQYGLYLPASTAKMAKTCSSIKRTKEYTLVEHVPANVASFIGHCTKPSKTILKKSRQNSRRWRIKSKVYRKRSKSLKVNPNSGRISTQVS